MVDQQNNDGQLLPNTVDNSSQAGDSSTPRPTSVDPATLQQAGDGPLSVPVQGDDTEAGDVDIIEKAWIDKAKHVVDQTSSDPFEQQKMISKVKAEYIKKRFNKDIKIEDE